MQAFYEIDTIAEFTPVEPKPSEQFGETFRSITPRIARGRC